MLELGQLRVEAIEAGAFSLDGGTMFGVVPRALWERQHPADARNRIRLTARCLLVRGPGTVALVDTGMGDEWSDKQRELFALDPAAALLARLEERGLAPGDVTDVVLTHLHFDHAGGLVRRGALTFPRATHHVQRRQWEWAQSPTERDRGSFRPENFALLQDSAQLNRVEGERELWPGFHVLPTDGHTAAHQSVLVEGGGRSALFAGDLIPTAAHLRAAWGMSYDLQPLQLLREKRQLLERAAADGTLVVFDHDPRLAACTVRREKNDFVPEREESL
jgi:glyoxylase-like metal-dependent hydrolase (beta-lactamase superfamily II)